MFFKPIRGYTRFQRITVTFSILFGSMCGTTGQARRRPRFARVAAPHCARSFANVDRAGTAANALFYQFGDESSRLSVIESLATRLIVGVLSSLVVFVPTTIIGILFKHTRPRTFVGKHFDEYTADDLDSMKIDVRRAVCPDDSHHAAAAANSSWRSLYYYCRVRPARQETYIAKRNWFQRVFLDWHMPWWVAVILYCVVAAGWIMCFYATLLYGVKFEDEKVRPRAGQARGGLARVRVLTAWVRPLWPAERSHRRTRGCPVSPSRWQSPSWCCSRRRRCCTARWPPLWAPLWSAWALLLSAWAPPCWRRSKQNCPASSCCAGYAHRVT